MLKSCNSDFMTSPKPRIISDNGPQFIAKDFKEFIRISGMPPSERRGRRENSGRFITSRLGEEREANLG